MGSELFNKSGLIVKSIARHGENVLEVTVVPDRGYTHLTRSEVESLVAQLQDWLLEAPAPAPRDDLTCLFHGLLGAGMLAHADCDVVLERMAQTVAPELVVAIPQVCKCECRTCKRAWFNAGRPTCEPGGKITTLAERKRSE